MPFETYNSGPLKPIFQSVKHVKTQNEIPWGIPESYWKIMGYLGNKNSGIFYPGIFPDLKSRDFWSWDFLIPGLSQDIPSTSLVMNLWFSMITWAIISNNFLLIINIWQICTYSHLFMTTFWWLQSFQECKWASI